MIDLCQYVDVCISNEEDAKDVFGIEAENTDIYGGELLAGEQGVDQPAAEGVAAAHAVDDVQVVLLGDRQGHPGRGGVRRGGLRPEALHRGRLQHGHRGRGGEAGRKITRYDKKLSLQHRHSSFRNYEKTGRRLGRLSVYVCSPILALTEALTAQEKIDLFHAGVDAFLEKPTDADVCIITPHAVINMIPAEYLTGVSGKEIQQVRIMH